MLDRFFGGVFFGRKCIHRRSESTETERTDTDTSLAYDYDRRNISFFLKWNSPDMCMRLLRVVNIIDKCTNTWEREIAWNASSWRSKKYLKKKRTENGSCRLTRFDCGKRLVSNSRFFFGFIELLNSNGRHAFTLLMFPLWSAPFLSACPVPRPSFHTHARPLPLSLHSSLSNCFVAITFSPFFHRLSTTCSVYSFLIVASSP